MTQEEGKARFFGTFPEDRINSLLNVKTSKSAALENTALKMLQFFCVGFKADVTWQTDVLIFKRSTSKKEK